MYIIIDNTTGEVLAENVKATDIRATLKHLNPFRLNKRDIITPEGNYMNAGDIIRLMNALGVD